MDVLTINIVPPEKISKKIRALQKEIAAVSKGKTPRLVPHVSLRENFEPIHEKELYRALELRLKDFKQFKVLVDGFQAFSPGDYIVLNVKKTPTLQKLREIITWEANQFRTAWVQSKYRKTRLKKKQRAYLNKFGFPYLFEFSVPHITLAFKTNPNQVNQAIALLKKRKPRFSFMAKKVTVFRKKNFGEEGKGSWKKEKEIPIG